MALSEVYCNPSIDRNRGYGTLEDPYGDFQYMLDTHATVTNIRINVKAGADEVFTSAPDWSRWAPNSGTNSPIFVEGYTTSAGDGGIGGIDCNGGAYGFTDGTVYSMKLKNLKIHNASGTAALVKFHQYNYIESCELYDAYDGVVGVTRCGVHGCYIHDCTHYGIFNCWNVFGNYLKNGATNKFTVAINAWNYQPITTGNIISVDGSTIGIQLWYYLVAFGNSIISDGGTGTGIRCSAATNLDVGVMGNLVEGFSGAGGLGIYLPTRSSLWYANNAVYNCTTKYTTPQPGIFKYENNEELTVSPFAKTGLDTFANRLTYFAPADVGNVLTGGYPNGGAKGAVPASFGGGGGGGGGFVAAGVGRLGVQES